MQKFSGKYDKSSKTKTFFYFEFFCCNITQFGTTAIYKFYEHDVKNFPKLQKITLKLSTAF